MKLKSNIYIPVPLKMQLKVPLQGGRIYCMVQNRQNLLNLRQGDTMAARRTLQFRLYLDLLWFYWYALMGQLKSSILLYERISIVYDTFVSQSKKRNV